VLVDLAADHPAEQTVETWLRADFALEDRRPDTTLRAALWADHAARWAPGVPAEAELWLRPGPTGLQHRAGPWTIEAGHLVPRRGRLDLLPAADVLVGRDLRAGPATPLGRLRQPTLLVNVQRALGPARLALHVQPVGAMDRPAFFGTDWALLPPAVFADLQRSLPARATDPLVGPLLAEAGGALLAGLDAANADSRAALEAALLAGGPDAATGARAEAVAEAGLDGAGWDLRLRGGWVRARRPALRIHPALAPLATGAPLPSLADLPGLSAALDAPFTLVLPRSAVAAADASAALGPVGLRVEAAAWSARALQVQGFGVALSPALDAALGLDWSPGPRLLLAAEARVEHLSSAPAGLLLVAPTGAQAAALARVLLARERLRLTAAATVDLAFAEALLRPEVGFAASDHLDLALAALLLHAPAPPPRTLAEAAAYTGGPIGYAGASDALLATLTWTP